MSRRYARSGGPSGCFLQPEASPLTITGGAANTKGSWTDLIASAARDVMGIGLYTDADAFTTNTDTSILLDIGVGNTGDAIDDILVPNAAVGYSRAFYSFYFPVFVRKGERIAARIQGTIASETFVVRPFLDYAPPPPHWAGFTRGDNLTALTNSAPTMGNFTSNAFEEVIASTVNPYKGVSFFPAIVNNSASNADMTVDLGVGPAGSEVVIGSWKAQTGASETVDNMQLPRFVCVDIPAGSRLAVRKNSTVSLTGVFIGWR